MSTIQVFDELGLLKQIKRFAGTSGGSITATLAAIGYPPCELEEILIKTNLEELAVGKLTLSVCLLYY